MKKLLLLLFLSHLGFAQLTTFTVTDSKEGIPGATIVLNLNGKIIAGATGGDGKAQIALEANKKYKIKVSAIGFETLEQEITISKDEFKVTLKASMTQLDEVSVTARKPLVRHEDDKSIVDPEALIQSSTNLMEVLEKTPGLFADSDGNMYISSQTPAKIYINGREQRLGSSDLATILRSLPPNAVERIEIIRTPSASMDASSSGGSINIVLRKGYSVYGSGSVSAGLNQGDYGNQFLNASYTRTVEKTTMFINGGVNWRNDFSFFNTERRVSSNNLLSSDSRVLSESFNGLVNYGISRELSKKWDIAYDGRLVSGKSESTNETAVSSFLQGQRQFQNQNSILNDGKNLYFNQNLNSVYKIDSLGSKLVVDFSYDLSRPTNNQNYNNLLQQENGQLIPLGFGYGANKSISNLYTLSTDLNYLFSNKIRLETGGKVSFQGFSSDAKYSRGEMGILEPDLFRTNSFDYRNRISALYLQGTKNWDGFAVKGGLRWEHTYMDGHQKIPSDTTFKIKRGDFFPFIYVSQRLGKIAGWDMRAFAIARRTISRPGYTQLNPFRRYVDEFTYEAGNPALAPQFTNNYEINISIDEYPIFAFGQNYVQDVFTSVLYQDRENPLLTFRTYDNLSKNKETYFRAVGALPPGGKYFFVAGAQFSLNEYSGLYEGLPVDFKRGTWMFFTFHEYKIDKRSSITMNGFYRTKGQQQFMELSDFGQLSFSVNRRFLNNKLVVTLNATDVLFTNKFNFHLNQGNMLADGYRYSDSRRVGLNLRYNFGQKKRSNSGFNLDVPTGESGIQ